MDDIKISIEGCNTEVSIANNAAEDFAKEAKNSANLALEQANRAKEIVDNSTENIESAKNQAIENAKYSIEEYQTTVLANLENSAGNLKNDMTNSMLTILDSTKQQADIAKYYAEQEHGQSDVTQNDLWTLERKTLFPTFEIRDESNILNELKTQRASSFDKSKFEIVGSPTITDDGRVLSTSESNWVYAHDFNALLPSKLFINFQAKVPNTLPVTHTYNACVLINSDDNTRFFVRLDNGGSILWCGYQKADGFYENRAFTVSENLELNVNINIDNSHIEFIINGEIINSGNDLRVASPVRYLTFGSGTGDAGYWNNFDLKTVSYSLDGVEVFSGNKTGLDVIKPDNYEVVGSPTITDDGVASGFNSTNYLLFNNTNINNSASSWKIRCEFTTNLTGENQIIWCEKISNMAKGYIRIESNKLRIHLLSDDNTAIINYILSSTVLTNNTNYIVEMLYTGTTYQVLLTNLSTNVTTTEVNITNDQKVVNMNTLIIGARGVSTPDQFFAGSIDLNAFKIYIDGNLVYQPCLKIPYTQAKLNHKIVDAVYRDRVQDLFEQVGYNGYFTLGENDFTLPSNKWSDVIDCYENGINKWEQRVDRTLRQQGSCTADEEVTLLKPYKDTNYVLNVPYASKTETGFIPTISGDWVANGKVYLD